jgi:TP901 family phage tail tape measure protein
LIGDVLVKVSADITDFTRNITGAANQMRHLGDDLQQAGSGIAMTFGSIAAASSLAIGATVKSASDYESAFAGVRKTVDGTEADFQRLSKGIIEMSKRMPESAEDIAAVAESAGQLGIEKDAILGFTETMTMMGTATNMSSTDAAEALARLANITQMPQDEFDRLGSTVVDLGNNLAATETDIVNMGLRIAGAGNTIGMSEDQILSFAGALSSVGRQTCPVVEKSAA